MGKKNCKKSLGSPEVIYICNHNQWPIGPYPSTKLGAILIHFFVNLFLVVRNDQRFAVCQSQVFLYCPLGISLWKWDFHFFRFSNLFFRSRIVPRGPRGPWNQSFLEVGLKSCKKCFQKLNCVRGKKNWRFLVIQKLIRITNAIHPNLILQTSYPSQVPL